MAALVGWLFLYKEPKPYSHAGQPSLNLVIFFKLMLMSQLENLVSRSFFFTAYNQPANQWG
ncbi:hypothetical protein [Hymenobacter sp. AT01-02]|uniref:hypothetical protein n=1 Tax=Hymenobacter sp. AT01-02 TaxID=1571877 RepID=UPI00128F078B|nr:hypothetical protein [Hymenobacter sp. AT01-02]